MPDDYKKNYLNQVILRIDFPTTPLDIKEPLPIGLLKIILPKFPVPEKKEIIEKTINFNFKKDDVDAQSNKIEEFYYFDVNKKKSICISKKYIFFVYTAWDQGSYKELESIFNNIITELFRSNDIQVTRLGLRYINHIELNGSDPTNWDGYLNKNVLSIFNMVGEEFLVSRAFQNLELILSDIRIRFQYGMNNPDYPAPIRKKLFVLDYDGSCEYLQEQKDLMDNLKVIHEEIGKLFKKSIDSKLEAILKGEQ